MTSFTKLSKIRTGVLPTERESWIVVISHHFSGFHWFHDEKKEICTRTTTIATTFCCYSTSHFCLMRIIPSWTSTSSQHRSSPSQHSIVVRTLTRPRIPSSQQWILLELRTKSLLFLRFVEIKKKSFFLKAFSHGTDSLPTSLCGLVFMLSERGRKQWSEA